MKILVTNDDGIAAPGIALLRELLQNLKHEVFLIAPEYQSSGVSHAITLNTPLMPYKFYKEGVFFGTAVNGTPADACRLGLSTIFSEIDMVISGINLGNNVGPAVYYSGTVAAAFEGASLGKPSIALSFDSFSPKEMAKLAKKLQPFLPALLEKLQDKGVLYNVNIPCSKIRGIRLTRQYMGYFSDTYLKRKSPRDKEYYWLTPITYTKEKKRSKTMNDLEAMKNGYISVTPLQFDMTDFRRLKKMADIFE